MLIMLRNLVYGAAIYKTDKLIFIWYPKEKLFSWHLLKYNNGNVFYEYKIGPFMLWKMLK